MTGRIQEPDSGGQVNEMDTAYTAASFDGLVVVDKPLGLSSMDVVRHVRRAAARGLAVGVDEATGAAERGPSPGPSRGEGGNKKGGPSPGPSRGEGGNKKGGPSPGPSRGKGVSDGG